jgi:hypothetical protein
MLLACDAYLVSVACNTAGRFIIYNFNILALFKSILFIFPLASQWDISMPKVSGGQINILHVYIKGFCKREIYRGHYTV